SQRAPASWSDAAVPAGCASSSARMQILASLRDADGEESDEPGVFAALDTSATIWHRCAMRLATRSVVVRSDPDRDSSRRCEAYIRIATRSVVVRFARGFDHWRPPKSRRVGWAGVINSTRSLKWQCDKFA